MTILGLFLNNEIRTGGHRRYLELMEDLAARGNRVTVILNEDLAYESAHFAAVRLPAAYVRRGFPPASQVFRAAVRKNLGRIAAAIGQVDWILIHGETHLSAAALLKRRFGARIFFGSRSNVVRWSGIEMADNRGKPVAWFLALLDNLSYRRYERRIAALVDVVCFQSAFDRDDFLSRLSLPAPPAVVIGGNIGGPRFKAEFARANRGERLKRLLFVGTLGGRKGLSYLLKALAILSSRGIRDLELDVLGGGSDLPAHQAYARSEGFADRVAFRGRVDPFPFYAAADLLVVPSLFDSYPDTVLEALHVGLPVIASRIGGIPDQLVHDELLFPIRDASAIADRIEALYRDENRYREIRRLCDERRESFDFDWPAAWERAMAERMPPASATAKEHP